MGYLDLKVREFAPDSYSYYDELGLSKDLVKSKLCLCYQQKISSIYMYWADTNEDVQACLDRNASLITANDPVPLLKNRSGKRIIINS